MSNKFDIKVVIKENLRKDLIFGISARLPIAMILGFTDFQHKVIPILQTLSHGTRAYIVNANGLPGFVLEFDIVRYLKKANETGQLEHAK